MDLPARTGLFVTTEGVDGAGKSTHLPHIERLLIEHGYSVLRTREPGGTPTADLLRTILLKRAVSSKTELLLLFASREEHLRKVILPALREGRCVLCDRFSDSTYAYQGHGRGIDDETIAFLENWIDVGLKPDLTILFDLPVEVSVTRRRSRSDEISLGDQFDLESESFFERVRAGFLHRVRREPARFYVVDSTPTIEQVQYALSGFLREWLARRQGMPDRDRK